MCSNRDLFRQPGSKNAGGTSMIFGLRLVSKQFQHPAIQIKTEQHILRIFSSNKSAPANGKTGFYANRDPNKQEVGFIFA
jgi:hypothetical protein